MYGVRMHVQYVWDANVYKNGSGAWLLSDACGCRCVTAFLTARKHYQFWNSKCSSCVSKEVMNVVMSGFPNKNVMVFI